MWAILRADNAGRSAVFAALGRRPRSVRLSCRALWATPRCVAAVSGSDRWRIGCWNQHRVGSYAQRNCPWVERLRAQGVTRGDLELLTSLPVQYAGAEVWAWVESCDVVAFQEVDEGLRQLLRKAPSDGELLESAAHVDGRGVEVDCTLGLFIPAGMTVVHRAQAELRFELPRGRGEVVRDHIAVLVGKDSNQDGQLLLLCPVHLHPPNTVEAAGIQYTTYLEPLKQLIGNLVSLAPESVACALVGDFNVTAEEFRTRTSGDTFWNTFLAVGCMNGTTAHRSNPCQQGDYGLFRAVGGGPSPTGAWRCEAHGAPDFQTFERYCDDIVTNMLLRIGLQRAHSSLSCTLEGLKLAIRGLHDQQSPTRPRPPPPPPLPAPQSLPSELHGNTDRAQRRTRPPPPHASPLPHQRLQVLPAFLVGTLGELGRLQGALAGQTGTLLGAAAPLLKGLRTSDHRPLVFEGGAPTVPMGEVAAAGQKRGID